MTSTIYLAGWPLQALVLSTAIAAAGYLAWSFWGGWKEVADAFAKIGFVGTLVALSMSLSNYALRFARWQLYLSMLGHRVPPLPSLRIYLSGFALTTTPGKAGEAFRSLLLVQRGVPFTSTFAALISERLSDLIAIVLLTLIGLAQYPQAIGVVLTGTLGITVVLIVLASQTLLRKVHAWLSIRQGKLISLAAHATRMLFETRLCHRPGLLVVATATSVVAWGAEAMAFYWVLGWLGAEISLSFAIFVYALSMLAGALSFLPGGLGGAEAAMVSLLAFTGIDMPTAIAATVFIRLATLWFAVAIGLFAILRSQRAEPLREEAA